MLRLIAAAFVVIVCGACNSTKKTALYSGECGGNTLALRLVSRTTFETIYHHHELVYNGRTVVVIDNRALDHELPLAAGDTGGRVWHYLDTGRNSFTPRGFAKALPKMRIVLYIDPKSCARRDFERLYACMAALQKPLQAAIDGTPDFQAWQPAAMVYAAAP